MVNKMGGMMPPQGNGDSEEKQAAPIAQFEGFVECPLFAEDAKISIYPDGVVIAAAMDLLFIPYGEVPAFSLEDSRVIIQMAGGAVTASRMGQEAEWLYQKLYGAYNDAVLAALLVDGESGFEADGTYRVEESESVWQGQAVIRLFEDCLCILPPGEQARRIPLCFLSGVKVDGFSLVLTLATGERYTLSDLGRELDNLQRLLTDRLRALREKTMNWHRELAPNLGSMQMALAAKLMPMGRAADTQALRTSAPALAQAVEEAIRESRIAQTYPWLQNLCGGNGLLTGILPPPPAEEPDPAEAAPDLSGASEEEPLEEQPEEPKPVLWIIASDAEQKLAAVELDLGDDEAAATYLYRVEGNWEQFSLQIDRALEATQFRRELILLPEDKLNTPEHLADAMLVARTPALGILRSHFAGRAIHSSLDRWKRDIEKCRAKLPAAEQKERSEPVKNQKFCTNCGAKLTQDAKFCGQCGTLQQ